MQNRIFISDLNNHIGQEVLISGSVSVRRDHGKLVFLDIRDLTGEIQTVVLPNNEKAYGVVKKLRSEWIVEVIGLINKRPEKMVNIDSKTGGIELEAKEIKVLSEAKELPFEFEDTKNINLDTYLDNLPLTLRSKKSRAIFEVQAEITKAFRGFMTSQLFKEIRVPGLVGGDAEGGAEVFEVDYFGKSAYLATSPQLYKQIMVGVFERVFTVSNVYRAEKHSTSRHLNEYTSLDGEFGFIKDHSDIMNLLAEMMRYIVSEVGNNTKDSLKIVGAEHPSIPDEIPVIKLRKAQEVIKKEYGEDCVSEPDLAPQHEKWLADYAKKKFKSDFIFVTHFPVSKRPFYTYEDSDDPGFTKSFDLLFRGLEIATGGQRVNDYDKLLENIKKWKLDPKNFEYYLQAFKYGMPPEGGFGMGLERLTEKMLGLGNVKEATLFPRDMNRIDTLLSE